MCYPSRLNPITEDTVLRSRLECLACVVQQGLRAARAATDDPELQRRIVDEVANRIADLDLEASPARNSQCAYSVANEVSGNQDPYKHARRIQNEMALALEPELRGLVENSSDSLVTALHLAAAGNVIDLGTGQSNDVHIHDAIEKALRERFAVDHTEALKESLDACSDLLYLLDNAGEIVFDKILIEELQRHTSVTAVVKGAPIINDAVFEDAEQVGLMRLCDVIDNGGPFIGSPPDLVPESFRQRMMAADMIVAKGQGNYETVDDFPGDVFLILKAKCEVVARHMGVQLGQVGLISTRIRRTSRT